MKEIIPSQGLVVSCQALADEPMHGSDHMAAMAKAAEMGGAIGIRANSMEDIAAIKQKVNLPIIGLNKRQVPGFDVYITPTVEEAVAVYRAGASIVAIDGTGRKRPDGKTLAETIDALHEGSVVVMADVSTFEEGIEVAHLGADYVSTTLSGYTSYSKQGNEPDLTLVSRLVNSLSVPVVAEGHIKTAEQVIQALDAGAHFVVVGSAITRPQCIVSEFTSQIREYKQNSKVSGRKF